MTEESAIPSSDGAECNKLLLTIDVSGLVLVRKVISPSSSSIEERNTNISTKIMSVIHVSKNRRNIVWKGNIFPLWKRALKLLRLKQLSPPYLPYALTNTTLSIWKMKDSVQKKQPLEDESSLGERLIDEWVKDSKPWKVFLTQEV